MKHVRSVLEWKNLFTHRFLTMYKLKLMCCLEKSVRVLLESIEESNHTRILLSDYCVTLGLLSGCLFLTIFIDAMKFRSNLNLLFR